MATRKKAAAQVADAMTAFKAFDKDWACRGYKFELGQTYEHEGKVALCNAGFHAVTVPFDAWSYYPGATNLARVTLGSVSADRKDDSKVVGARITIDARLTLPEWITAQVEAVIGLCKDAAGSLASKKLESAAATGYGGHAAATGDSGHAAATGVRGHAAATGYGGHAAATGDSGHAAATGYGGHAAATGYGGHAAATGHGGHAAATGHGGHAAATGDSGHAAATGYGGHAAATGYGGIACALGVGGSAKAGPDGWIVLAHWAWNGSEGRYELIGVKTAKVGGPEGIEAGKSYRLDDAGSFEVAPE